MTFDECKTKFGPVQEGTVVRSTDGEKLGTVISFQNDAFVIEKGFFFPKDYLVRYDDVVEFRDGDLIIARRSQELRESFDSDTDVGTTRTFRDEHRFDRDTERDDITVPVREEELQIEKRMEEVGEVRVSKHIVTEEKQISVPVRREEIEIERVATDRRATSDLDAGDLKEETIRVPIREEKVTVSKRPVVKEEVRLRKVLSEEQRDVDGTVRKEEVDIDESNRQSLEADFGDTDRSMNDSPPGDAPRKRRGVA